MFPSSSQRKLVSVREISKIQRIPRSDEVAIHIDGWTVLVPKRRLPYQVSDLVIYFEIDSFIPKNDSRFWELFTDPTATEVFRGKEGYRVKSRRSGNRLSQGLIYPLSEFPEINLPYEAHIKATGKETATASLLNQSFAALLNVNKWEFTETAAALPSLGKPPSFIRLPGWQRIQDIERSIFSTSKRRKVWQITEKLDGVTMVVYKLSKASRWASCLPALPAGCSPAMQDDKNRYGVCSRTEDLIDREDSLYWQAVRTSGVLEKMGELPGLENCAVQGELCGASVEGNTMNYPEGVHEFVVFGVWDIDGGRYLPPKVVEGICCRLGIKHTPVVGYSTMERWARDVHELLAKAEGPSGFGGVREGFVFKSLDGAEQFKVISNAWLSLMGK